MRYIVFLLGGHSPLYLAFQRLMLLCFLCILPTVIITHFYEGVFNLTLLYNTLPSQMDLFGIIEA